MSSLTDNTVMNNSMTTEEFITEKDILMNLFIKYNMEMGRRTPFGMLGKAMEYFSKDDLLEMHYNTYFNDSLLRNSNKWL
jgi:hypothetical protein